MEINSSADNNLASLVRHSNKHIKSSETSRPVTAPSHFHYPIIFQTENVNNKSHCHEKEVDVNEVPHMRRHKHNVEFLL